MRSDWLAVCALAWLSGCPGDKTGDDSGAGEDTGETGGEETGGGETGGSDTSEPSDSSETSETGDTSETGETGDPGPVSDCPSELTLEVLDRHVQALLVSSDLLAGHGGEHEAVSMFQLPGYEGVTAQYASLFMVCSESTEYDPWCEGDLCWQLACPSYDASNLTRGWIADPPLDVDGFVFESGTVDTLWDASTDLLTWTISSETTDAEGLDYSVSGEGSVDDAGAMTLTETFPALLSDSATLEAAYDPGTGTLTGQLTAGGVVVAIFDELGHLVATEECP